MSNLLKETLAELKKNGKKEKDVLWVGNMTHKTNWENFKQISDVDYDSGFGGQEVATDLLIVGDNWWEFKQLPKEPTETIELKKIVGGSWSKISEINDNDSDD